MPLLFEDRGCYSEARRHSERLWHDPPKYGHHARSTATNPQLSECLRHCQPNFYVYIILFFQILSKLLHIYCEQVVTCDADVTVDVWRPMVLTAVNRSFNQITVLIF